MSPKLTAGSNIAPGLSWRGRIRQTTYNVLEALNLRPMVWNVGNAFKVHEFRELVDQSGLNKSHQVLDLGCGTGLQTVLLAKRSAHVWGVDVSPKAIRKAQERALRCSVSESSTFICSPLEVAGLEPESIDRVFSFCVLEHIPNLDVVLAELLRLMKPGAEMHVTVDSLGTIKNQPLIDKHRRDHYVVEYFTPASIRARLEQAGFEIKEAYPLFTGETARQAFSERINDKHGSSMLAKWRLYRELKRENAKTAEAGIMVLVRARKPLR